MPKVLVLFDANDQNADALAESTVEGAKSVRFTEVDIRVVGDESAVQGTRRRRLESRDAVDQYDGVVLVSSDHAHASGITALLDELEQSAGDRYVNRVFGAVPGSDAMSARLMKMGAILIGTRGGSDDSQTSARKTGERVAKVAEWVRHALGHEHGHGGHSHHAHSHHSH